MTDRSKKESFVQRYLDPASRLGEILFGLTMVVIGLALVDVAILLGG